MSESKSLDTVRGIGALLTLGACFIWFGLATPSWSSFAWLGALLLAGSAVITTVMTKSMIDGFRSPQTFRRAPSIAMVTMTPKVIRCQYCKTRINASTTKCSSCGAPA